MTSEPSLRLYHCSPSRSSIVLWMLEEVGQSYALTVLDMGKGELKTPDYLAINPMGKVPALVHDGVVVTEAAAICLYLADAFPDAGLAPAVGDPLRGPYLRWSFFGSSCLGPAVIDRMLDRPPGRALALSYGDFDTTVSVIAGALETGPFLLGERFSAADVIIGSTLGWAAMVKAVPELPAFARYAERIGARPALQRARAKDAELMAAAKAAG